MNEGDVVLATLPQADGKEKPRPAVVLRMMPPFGDWLICGISTQLQHQVHDLDEIIETNHLDFASSGLKAVSLIRPGFLALQSSNQILGVLGHIDSQRHRRLLQNLCRHLGSK